MRAARFALAFAATASLALSACGEPGSPDSEPGANPTVTTEDSPAPTAPATVAAPEGEPTTGVTTASNVDSNPPGDACGASQVATYVSQEATPAVRAQVRSKVGHDRIRWLDPDSVITMDFRSDRLNVMLDKNGIITGAKCQ